MPASNPFAPVIEVGGGANLGPASASANARVGNIVAGQHHGTAFYLVVALAVLVVLHRSRYRFSTTVG